MIALNPSQNYHNQRSFQYICFQNKANHYYNLKYTKPTIDYHNRGSLQSSCSKSKQFCSVLDNGEFKLNNKRRKQIQRNIKIENEKLLSKLYEIMHTKVSHSSNRPLTPSQQGYRYMNNTKQKQILNSSIINRSLVCQCQHCQQQEQADTFNTYKRIFEKRLLNQENCKFAKRLAFCKPAVGTQNEWDQHYDKFLKNKNIRRNYSAKNKEPKLNLCIQPKHLLGQYVEFINDNNLYKTQTTSFNNADYPSNRESSFQGHKTNLIDQKKLFSYCEVNSSTPPKTSNPSKRRNILSAKQSYSPSRPQTQDSLYMTDEQKLLLQQNEGSKGLKQRRKIINKSEQQIMNRDFNIENQYTFGEKQKPGFRQGNMNMDTSAVYQFCYPQQSINTILNNSATPVTLNIGGSGGGTRLNSYQENSVPSKPMVLTPNNNEKAQKQEYIQISQLPHNISHQLTQ